MGSVTVNAETRSRVDNMLSRLDYIVVVVVLCAAALAFIVLYNLTNINITERIREIATIKVLGFYPGETASYVESEPVFYVDGSFDVYPNVTAPSPWWRLGNWKRDGAEAVLENYRESRSFAQRARLTVPAGELVRTYGDPESRRLFGRDDYIELMLARYCREHWEGGAS